MLQWRRTPRHPHASALRYTFSVLILLLPLWMVAVRWYEAQILVGARAQTAEQVSLQATALSAAINRRFALLQGLYAFVQAQPTALELDARFEKFAAGLYNSVDVGVIRNIAVAPGGFVRYVYPLEGNEQLLRYIPIHDPRPQVRAEIDRALHTRRIILSGPTQLVEGGVGLVARQALYLDGEFWGLVSITLNVTPFLEEAGMLDPAHDLDLALRDQQGEIFAGAPQVFDHRPVIGQIELPEGNWQLAGAPKAGWQAVVAGSLRLFQTAGLLIAGLVAGLTYLSINRQGWLALAVQERTQDLSDINQQLQEAYAVLEQRVAERTQELSTLLQMASVVVSTLDPDQVLDRILDQLQRVVRYDSASVQTLQEQWLTIIAARGFDQPHRIVGLSFPLTDEFPNGQVIQEKSVLNLDDAPASYASFRRPPHDQIRSWLGIPLRVQDRVAGMITLDRFQPGGFAPEEVRIVLAFADQAALALENARLYAQAEQVAVLEERQRIARELHDSVSQALYGIGLGARTAREALDEDPGEAAESLEYVLSLAEAGLTEMRALILELRPEALEREGLIAALVKQAASLRLRHQIEVRVDLGNEPAIAPETKQALYRVAQEALHNVAKHAQASTVELRLYCQEDTLVLDVRDNGIGFDPQGAFPGHFGLHSMRERIGRLGGTLSIASQPGAGALVRAQIPFK